MLFCQSRYMCVGVWIPGLLNITSDHPNELLHCMYQRLPHLTQVRQADDGHVAGYLVHVHIILIVVRKVGCIHAHPRQQKQTDASQ